MNWRLSPLPCTLLSPASACSFVIQVLPLCCVNMMPVWSAFTTSAGGMRFIATRYAVRSTMSQHFSFASCGTLRVSPCGFTLRQPLSLIRLRMYSRLQRKMPFFLSRPSLSNDS